MERARVHVLHAGRAPRRSRLRSRRFDHGRLVVNLVDLPIKCPVAPLEFTFLADWFLQERSVRGNVEITFVDPARRRVHAACRGECASSDLLTQKESSSSTEFNAGEVDGLGGVLSFYDGRTVDFDLLVTVPLHGGAAYVERSPGLGDALGFVRTDR